MNGESVSVVRYCGIFGIVYAALLFAVNVLDHGFGMDLGRGVTSATLIAAAYGAVSFFLKDNGRVPDARERRRLTWGSIFISYVVSIVVASVVLSATGTSFWAMLSEINQKVTPILLGVAVIIVTLLYYLFLGLCYRVFGGIALKTWNARQS
jgi:hypothetical protein